jgi:hypothetical protein
MVLLTLFYIIGIAFILLSIRLKFWRGKRKFNRRNAAGLETFSSYEKSLSVSYLENFIQFLYIFLMIVGVLILLTAIFNSHDIRRVNHW